MIPTTKKSASKNWWDYSMLVYGPQKMGKTWGANTWPEPLFLATEPGHKGIEAMIAECYTWDTLAATVDEAVAMCRAKKAPFKTIILDTLDSAYQLAEAKVIQETGATSIMDGKNTWGKGTKRAVSKVLSLVKELLSCGFPVILIGQEYRETMKEPDGTESTKIVPLPKQIREISGMVDVLAHLELAVKASPTGGTVTKVRKLRTQASNEYHAGDRSGVLADMIEYTFDAYKACFDRAQPKGETK